MSAPLILASRSKSRQNMLIQAGLRYDCHPANLDEELLLRRADQDGMPPAKIAALLAQQKAAAIAAHYPDAFVIGSDQILCFDGEIFMKAETKDEAAQALRRLCGKTHTLISAVCVVRNGDVLWACADEAHLTMRDFDDAFLQHYLSMAGDELTTCVGSYALEGAGMWLFDRVEGDYYTVLGMPLFPLLGFLQSCGVGPSYE